MNRSYVKIAMLLLLVIITSMAFAQSRPDPISKEAPMTIDVTPLEITSQATVTVTVGAADTYSICLKDASGNIVKELYNGTLSIGTHTFYYDRFSAGGNPPPAGTYGLAIFRATRNGMTKIVLFK